MLRISILICTIFAFAVSARADQPYVAVLSGQQEVPANNSEAKGFCLFTLLGGDQMIIYTCRYNGMSSNIIAGSIHQRASIGENAPVLYPMETTENTEGECTGFLDVPHSFIEEMRNNRWYVNLSSVNFPSGEIRGQLHLANGAVNDFDGDGRTDLTVYRNSSNTFYAQSLLNNNFFTKRIGQPGDVISPTVDFDADGLSDFSTTTYGSEILWRIFKSSTETLEKTRWGSSNFGDILAPADYDGDGVTDIAVFRAGVWYIIESSTRTFRYEYFGQAGDIPAPVDINRDGPANLGVVRNEGGQKAWYFRNFPLTPNYSFVWGLSSDEVFTGHADWNGDGAADFTVIRNEGGQKVFYILLGWGLGSQVVRWGLSSDVVKLGDYDGDGKTDAAVTRAVDGQKAFYILQSTNGALRYETFGLHDDF